MSANTEQALAVSAAPGAPQINDGDVKVGQWICLEDPYSGGFGKFVKVLEIYARNCVTYAVLADEDSITRWGEKVRGESEDVSFPIYGWVQL